MDNKITPTPWVITDFCLANYTIESGNIRILKTFHDDSAEACKANAEAIVSAVNNTYGAGINPEAVPGLLQALIAANKYLAQNAHQTSYQQFGLESIEKAKL